MRIVLLDSGPLGGLTHPRPNREIVAWLATLRQAGTVVRVSEMADYEIRRELIRAGRVAGIERLDDLGNGLGTLPITGAVLRRAGELWASARRQGRPTAADAAIDADVIIAAQAQLAAADGNDVVVATTNVRHLARFVAAGAWEDIR